jgi:hypothetical protein
MEDEESIKGQFLFSLFFFFFFFFPEDKGNVSRVE